MKNKIIFVLTLLSSWSSASTNLVVPEKIVSSWGYQTESNDTKQTIKRLKPIKSGNENWYPGFKLSKQCYKNMDIAIIKEQETVDSINEMIGGFKVYRNSFLSNNCIFEISTWAKYYYLEFQPAMFGKFKTYLLSVETHNQ